jgi:hypothetical protein
LRRSNALTTPPCWAVGTAHWCGSSRRKRGVSASNVTTQCALPQRVSLRSKHIKGNTTNLPPPDASSSRRSTSDPRRYTSLFPYTDQSPRLLLSRLLCQRSVRWCLRSRLCPTPPHTPPCGRVMSLPARKQSSKHFHTHSPAHTNIHTNKAPHTRAQSVKCHLSSIMSFHLEAARQVLNPHAQAHTNPHLSCRPASFAVGRHCVDLLSDGVAMGTGVSARVVRSSSACSSSTCATCCGLRIRPFEASRYPANSMTNFSGSGCAHFALSRFLPRWHRSAEEG